MVRSRFLVLAAALVILPVVGSPSLSAAPADAKTPATAPATPATQPGSSIEALKAQIAALQKENATLKQQLAAYKMPTITADEKTKLQQQAALQEIDMFRKAVERYAQEVADEKAKPNPSASKELQLIEQMELNKTYVKSHIIEYNKRYSPAIPLP